MAKLGSIKDIYSDDTLKAQQKLTEVENSKPGEYQSQYSEKINSVLDGILNRKEFSYDFNADPLYQQYKDQYTQLGNQAMMNTVANAATMSGGYGNSYGVTAGAQANQAYMQQLNNVIPELYNAALQKYDMDTQNMYNQFSALGSQEDREYGKYRDTVSDWQTDRGYYNDKFNSSVSNDQYVSGYNQTEEQNEREYQMWLAEMQYQQARDAVSDSQWQQQWDYQLQQDALANAAKQAASAGSRSTGSSKRGSSSSSNDGAGNTTAIAKAAAQLKGNPNSGGGSYTSYIAKQVDSGNITEKEAINILKDLNSGKIQSNGKLYVN